MAKKPTRTITVRVPAELHARLVCMESILSMNRFAIMAIESLLKQYEDDQPESIRRRMKLKVAAYQSRERASGVKRS